MYDALDVARYIINYSNQKGYGISNLRLQKLLYFIQAYFLTFTQNESPCFDDEIQAWDLGPVVPTVYHEFKKYGSCSILPVTEYYDFSNSDSLWDAKKVHFSEDVIETGDRSIINKVVDKLSNYSAYELVQITHNQKPWKSRYQANCNNVIENELIKEYFKDVR